MAAVGCAFAPPVSGSAKRKVRMPLNLITDVAGLTVGQADDPARATGVTVVMVEEPSTASVAVRGGAPGGRDITLLEPEMTRPGVHAFVLSGGSAIGLDAAGGVSAVLRSRGIGFRIGPALVPIVSQAIIFDLINGGDKNWGMEPYYWHLGRKAAEATAGGPFQLGTAGAGYGGTTSTFKGGTGSASQLTASGFTVGAIVAVNAIGSPTIGSGPHFWAAAVEQNGEFGGLGSPTHLSAADLELRIKGARPVIPTPATTIAVVATNATLTKAQCKRLAIMADDGLARAIRPAHAPMDGDTIFACSTMRKDWPAAQEGPILTELGMAAGDCLARAIARGVYEATALPFPGAVPAWRDRYPEHFRARG